MPKTHCKEYVMKSLFPEANHELNGKNAGEGRYYKMGTAMVWHTGRLPCVSSNAVRHPTLKRFSDEKA